MDRDTAPLKTPPDGAVAGPDRDPARRTGGVDHAVAFPPDYRFGPMLRGPGPDPVMLLPVVAGRSARPLGVYAVGPESVRFHPAIDVPRLVALGVAAVGLVALNVGIAMRRRPQIGAVTMGPGGWISVKGLASAPRAARTFGTPRPWWAHVLRAKRLVVQR